MENDPNKAVRTAINPAAETKSVVRSALKQAAETFRKYEQLHLAKDRKYIYS